MNMSKQDCIPNTWRHRSGVKFYLRHRQRQTRLLLFVHRYSMAISVRFEDAIKTKVRLIVCVQTFVTSDPSALRSIYVSRRSWQIIPT